VAAIDQADAALQARTSALRADLDELKAWAGAEGVDLGPAAFATLEALESDPLGALDQVAAAEKAVETLKARRAEISVEIVKADASLAKASADLEALRKAIGEAKTLADECAASFEGAVPVLDAAAEERSLGELEAWLETLRATRKAGRLKAALIGISKWDEARAAREATTRSTIAAWRRLVAAREDTAGRLRALRAKARALAATRPPPPSLAALEDLAKAEVRRTPYAAARAEAAVKAFEDALVARKS
jgi:chromosome segregation ATPase